jgi:ABC-type transporter Mla MlaB component
MRGHGLVSSAGGLGAQDHVCWPFADGESFRRAALEFLSDGRRLGQRLMYVGDGPPEKLRADLEPLGDFDALIERGALEVLSLSAIYRVGQRIDPKAQLAVYAGATEGALADGYTGLRVVSEATALGADPANRAALTRWESLADRYAASHPVAGLCGYDRQALPDELVADLAAVHPLARDAGTLVPFRLFARPGALALEGDVDYFSAGALSRLLALTDWNEGELELDLSELGFIDHHGVLALAEHQRRLAQHGVKLTIRGAPSWVRRICDVLGVAL